MFVVLGMFLDGFAMLVLSIPAVWPILEPFGVELILFGALAVIALEMGLISPPASVNLFIVKSIAPSVPMSTIFCGIWPFWFAVLAAIIVILVIPEVALLLPDTMFN